MAGNTVVLTIAGESRSAEDAFSRVGQASEDMSRQVDSSADSFGRAAETADMADTRAMGFRDTLTGIQDGAEGIKLAASGEWGFETLLLLGFGIGDLASGLANFLIPAVKSATVAIRGMSLALLTSPITWIVLGIGLLVGAIVLIATKTDWFQRAWRNSWGWIKSTAQNVWEWLKVLPSRIGEVFSKVSNFITRPFRSAFNFVADAWNNTIGRLSWTIPGWVPGIGGNSISVPNIPKFHSGGVVPGTPGSEQLALLQAGERVSPATSGGSATLILGSDGSLLGDALIEIISRAVRRQGGDVQLVLGGRNA